MLPEKRMATQNHVMIVDMYYPINNLSMTIDIETVIAETGEMLEQILKITPNTGSAAD